MTQVSRYVSHRDFRYRATPTAGLRGYAGEISGARLRPPCSVKREGNRRNGCTAGSDLRRSLTMRRSVWGGGRHGENMSVTYKSCVIVSIGCMQLYIRLCSHACVHAWACTHACASMCIVVPHRKNVSKYKYCIILN